MAEIRKQKFKCPKCGEEIDLELLERIEVPYDEQYKAGVMNDTFYLMHCKHCNMVLPFAYDSSYNDLERRFLIWLVPERNQQEEKRIADYNQRLEKDDALRLAQNDYRFRIVRNSTDLREKILIFEAGLDDRVIELMKVAYVPSIRKTCGTESKIVGFYFDWRIDGEGGQWMVVFDNRKPMIAPFDKKVYKEIAHKWEKSIQKHTEKGLTAIDARWASQVMQEK